MEKIKEILCWIVFVPVGILALPYVMFVSLFIWRKPTFIFVGLYQVGIFLSFCAIGICFVVATSVVTFSKKGILKILRA